MHCLFEPTETPGIYYCPVCRKRTRQASPRVPRRVCTGETSLLDVLPCPHRGAELRQEQCELCGAQERLIPIHVCALFGECALTRIRAAHDYPTCLCCDQRPSPP